MVKVVNLECKNNYKRMILAGILLIVIIFGPNFWTRRILKNIIIAEMIYLALVAILQIIF